MAAKFCSECGERLKFKRAGILRLRSFCPRCPARLRRNRLMLVAIPALCAAIGFAIGHYTSTREPFYFIGTPVDLSANSVAQPAANRTQVLGQPVGSSSVADAICGARTRSGKACQRKVKGGGYCWQHRDKQAEPKRGSAQP